MHKPKILFYDIETCPNLVLDFACGYNKSIDYNQVIEERQIISVAYKYAGQKKTHVLKWDVTGKGVAAKRSDKEVVRKFAEVLRECDVAVAHNGDKFDLKWIKGRVLYHRLPPVTNVSTIDTLKLSRQNFNLNTHRLDYLARYLFSKNKLKTDFKLWKDVWAGDEKQLNYMVKYNKKDVVLLEKAFNEMLPYCDKTPISLGIVRGKTRDECPMCGGAGRKYGVRISRIGRYQRHQCKSCAHVWNDSRMIKEEGK